MHRAGTHPARFCQLSNMGLCGRYGIIRIGGCGVGLCRANTAYIRQPGPDSVPGFRTNFLKSFNAVPSSLGSGPVGRPQRAVTPRGPELVEVAPDVPVLLRSRAHYYKTVIYHMFIIIQSPIITSSFRGSQSILECLSCGHQGAVAARGPERIEVARDVPVG